VPTRLVHLVIDANDPPALGRFWAAVLGWDVLDEEPSETGIGPAGYAYPDPVAQTLVFVPVAEPKRGKNRVHLDLATASAEHQAAEVDRILALGATKADIGQGDVPWEVLADPEGNEFCVLDPQPEYYQGTGLFGGIVVDCADPAAMADFWELAAGWRRHTAGANGISLRAPEGVGPYLTLLRVPDPKTVKNRMHLDVAPYAAEDHAEAVAVLRAAGATPVDIGQGDVRWQVMTDPEGSEFCVLTPR
jgi:predicted enzyme related to lactoylglutathione lyase